MRIDPQSKISLLYNILQISTSTRGSNNIPEEQKLNISPPFTVQTRVQMLFSWPK
jgi:hypothetical protein